MGKGLRCPSCDTKVIESKAIFYVGVRCRGCGRTLRVSTAYARTLVLLSGAIGLLLVWIAGVRSLLGLSVFLLPIGFLVGTVVVPVALHVLPPSLSADEPGHLTTLALGRGEDDHHD